MVAHVFERPLLSSSVHNCDLDGIFVRLRSLSGTAQWDFRHQIERPNQVGRQKEEGNAHNQRTKTCRLRMYLRAMYYSSRITRNVQTSIARERKFRNGISQDNYMSKSRRRRYTTRTRRREIGFPRENFHGDIFSEISRFFRLQCSCFHREIRKRQADVH